MRRQNLLTTAFIIACLLLTAAQTVVAANVPDSVTVLVADTKKAINTIDMTAFKSVLDDKAYDLIIDVREADEFVDGYVPGAINIPRGLIEFKIWPHVGFPDNTNLDLRIYLYCKTGSRCALATKSLKDLGFTRVIAVDMKLEDWEDADYPWTR